MTIWAYLVLDLYHAIIIAKHCHCKRRRIPFKFAVNDNAAKTTDMVKSL